VTSVSSYLTCDLCLRYVFSVQTLLPGLAAAGGGAEVKSPGAESGHQVSARQMVRTDCRAQKLDAFLRPKEKPDPEAAGPSGGGAATNAASDEMEEADDEDMLRAVAEQEAEGSKVNEGDADGAHRCVGRGVCVFTRGVCV